MTVDSFLSEFEDVKIPQLGVRLPEFQVEEKYKKELNLKSDATNFDFLRELCKRGFNKLKLKKGSKEYEEYGARVKYELGMFKDLLFTDYILLVWDVMNFCQEKDIAVGMGRGSGVSSLCLFLIGVTKVDPIKSGLYF